MAVETEIERLAQGYVHVLETFEGAEDVFARDAFFDINVPYWRFQMRGRDAFLAWGRDNAPATGFDVVLRRILPASDGFVIEYEATYEMDRQHYYFRNLCVCKMDAGLISEVSYWCTGDWDEETRARHAVEVPMERA